MPDIKVIITTRGKPVADIVRDITTSWFEMEGDIAVLRERTTEEMRKNIRSHIKRPYGSPGRLEVAINSDLFVNLSGQAPFVGFGVGNIDFLEHTVPYYKAINYGSGHILHLKGTGKVPVGYFEPGEAQPTAFGSGSRWIPDSSKGNYSFIPKNPIRPINYIENTEHWFGKEVAKILARHSDRLGRK